MTIEQLGRYGEQLASGVSLGIAIVAIFRGDWPMAATWLLGAILFELCLIRRALSAGEKP